MQTFSLFTTDTRYSLPILTYVVADGEQRAIELAKANLDQSEFHRSVELRDGSRAIYQRLKVA
ncbi:MAG: hypothetical protein JWO83_3246 [Caulobacteraceae bacterium]|nr:hypothetical protein [Caulobacteraceae bacterium]